MIVEGEELEVGQLIEAADAGERSKLQHHSFQVGHHHIVAD